MILFIRPMIRFIQKIFVANGKKTSGSYTYDFLILLLFILLFYFVRVSFSVLKESSDSMSPALLKGDWIFIDKLGYGETVRLAGKEIRVPLFRKIERGDLIVFRFPEGDTVYTFDPLLNYYEIKRRSLVEKTKTDHSERKYLPLTERIKYMKRCIALPGDTIMIEAGKICLNGERYDEKYPVKRKYHLYLSNPNKFFAENENRMFSFKNGRIIIGSFCQRMNTNV